MVNDHQDGRTAARTKLVSAVERFETPLLRYIGQMLRPDQQAAEDVVQETFLRLHKQLEDKGRTGIRSLKSWLFVVARNLALDMVRKRGREKELWGGVFQDGMGDKQLVPRGNGELGKVMQKEACEHAVEELHKLPDEEKEVLVLRIMEGMTLREISIVTGLKVGNVDYRINKGLRQLTKRMKTVGVI